MAGLHAFDAIPCLSCRLSNTMDASFWLAALEETLARCGKPEIFNADSR